MARTGRPRKHNFQKGDRLINKRKGPTRWTYIKDLPPQYEKRRILAVCDCGSIEVRYLSEILHGKSTGCRKCAEMKHGHGINPNSLRQCSLTIGMRENYFSNMKRDYPERFFRIQELGKGDLVVGWYKEQELKEKGKLK